MKQLPMNDSDFKVIRSQNQYFVDKSYFIEQVNADWQRVILITRPRRFGKTTNLSMLRYFYDNCQGNMAEVAANNTLFAGLKIADKEVFTQQQGQHPVISMTLKDQSALNWDEAYAKLQSLISDFYIQHDYLVSNESLKPHEKNIFQAIIDKKASEVELQESLAKLINYLARYFDSLPVVLGDEYDTPLQSAYLNGGCEGEYYKKMANFLRGFLGPALKDNPKLHKAVFTGIVRVAKASLFTGLNNFECYTVLAPNYADCFGFTETEVEQLVTTYSPMYNIA
ncbi:MAG: AAA family ATPase, partial [Gammaproteobacteria bacterium]